MHERDDADPQVGGRFQDHLERQGIAGLRLLGQQQRRDRFPAATRRVKELARPSASSYSARFATALALA